MKKKFKFVTFIEVQADNPKKKHARQILCEALEDFKRGGGYASTPDGGNVAFTGYKYRNPRSREQAKQWRDRESKWRAAVAESKTTLGFAAWVSAQA